MTINLIIYNYFYIKLIAMKTHFRLEEKSQRTNLLDEVLLNNSKELFKIPNFGYGIAVIINIIFLYYWCKKATLFSTFLNIFLVYLIFKIVQVKLLKR